MKHLFFDLDHTLWDFEKNSEIALEKLFNALELEKQIRSFRHFHSTYKKINRELWQQYSKGAIEKSVLRVKRFDDTLKHLEVYDNELAEYLATQYVETAPHHTHLLPNTKETLKALDDLGYHMHIITNGFKEIQDIKLTKSDIKFYFNAVICSEDVGRQKPAPEVFAHALDVTGAQKNESVMIGDNYLADVIGAERFGMSAVLYDPHREHREGTHEWHIHDLAQIPELLPWIAKTKTD